MKKLAILGPIAIIFVVATGLWLSLDNDVTSMTGPSRGSNEAAVNTADGKHTATDPSFGATSVAIGTAAQIDAPAIQSEDDDSEDPAKMFTADAAGNLVLKERTRLNVEKLLSLYSPEELQRKMTVIEQSLPSKAQTQFRDLLEQYKNFTAAARQAYPPGVAPATMEDAIALNEGLSTLRKAHFGAEGAEQMFGREERINRQLLEFMSLEKHEGLTMEEKAQKAQEMLSHSPDLMAAYENNRKPLEHANKN